MSDPATDFSQLTGVRSGKNSYYSAFVRSSERLQRTVRAMDRISAVVVRTVEGPRGVLEEVARAAAGHLDAEWVVLALVDGHLHGARPRFVAIGADGECHTETTALPDDVNLELARIRTGEGTPRAIEDDWVRAPMRLEGRQIGILAALHGLPEDPEPDDLAVLRILANQAMVSLHTSQQYQGGVTLHRQAQRLKAAAELRAQDLAARTAELEATEQRLNAALQREVIDTERHRIARELHDSVTQYVLSAGMIVEVARGSVEDHQLAEIAEQLGQAKMLTQTAVEQLRTSIYALTHTPGHTATTLKELIDQLVENHRSALQIRVVAEGRAHHVGDAVNHEIARSVGEALFNVMAHADATQVVIRLRYRATSLTISIADDGRGDPTQLRRMLRLEQRSVGDGRHRGLRNMHERMQSLGGSLTFRRARLGGVRVVLQLPLDPDEGPTTRTISEEQ